MFMYLIIFGNAQFPIRYIYLLLPLSVSPSHQHRVDTLEKSLKIQGVFSTHDNSRTPLINPGKKFQHLENTLENFSNTAQMS